jgi:hypothetical protein
MEHHHHHHQSSIIIIVVDDIESMAMSHIHLHCFSPDSLSMTQHTTWGATEITLASTIDGIGTLYRSPFPSSSANFKSGHAARQRDARLVADRASGERVALSRRCHRAPRANRRLWRAFCSLSGPRRRRDRGCRARRRLGARCTAKVAWDALAPCWPALSPSSTRCRATRPLHICAHCFMPLRRSNKRKWLQQWVEYATTRTRELQSTTTTKTTNDFFIIER